MQHAPSNNFTPPTPTNVACSYPPISITNPNPNYKHSTTAKSPMATSFPVAAAANKENICPLSGSVANSVVSPAKRMRRFVRKPLADITNHFQHTIPSSSNDDDALFGDNALALTLKKKMLKRKTAGEGIGNDDKMSSRSKMLRISFR